MVLQADPMHDFSAYDLLKEQLYDDTRRMVLIKSRGQTLPSHCEGQGFRRHSCLGGLELNHVLVNRQKFRSLPPEERRYFDHEINCALNCSWFHRKYGETDAYRHWHQERVARLFGMAMVVLWLEDSPLSTVVVHRAQKATNGSGRKRA